MKHQVKRTTETTTVRDSKDNVLSTKTTVREYEYVLDDVIRALMVAMGGVILVLGTLLHVAH